MLCLASCPEGLERACYCFIRCRFIVSLSLALGLSRGCPTREHCGSLTFLRTGMGGHQTCECTAQFLWVDSTFSVWGGLFQRMQIKKSKNINTTLQSWVYYPGNYWNGIDCWQLERINSKRCKVNNPNIAPAHGELKVLIYNTLKALSVLVDYDCILSR